ncbi:MBL fold metallo-hydrolase [Thioclava litoralis]|uniref:MBL fold metallo-hydrolase n=1 Tax=Thioclava litoralis TaxID=3076557 RepID=A0ABZ1E1V8_9RHOB|nr:MBL fold metallo-hydrolase [Thioclava sp. FTW29]
MSTHLTRRNALLTVAVAPVAGATLTSTTAFAQTDEASMPSQPAAIPAYRRFVIGDLTVTTLLAGTKLLPEPHGTFGLNASDGEFTALSEANFLPTDRALNSFTPVVVETGDAKILFDTGLDVEGLTGAMKAAGVAPQSITHVVITHMHGDHIGGLMGEDGPTFPDATHITGQVEWDYWSQTKNAGFDAKLRPLEDRFQFINPDDEFLPGFKAVDAYGHTPGMLAYWITSGGQQLVLTADTANHYVWSLQRPDWEVRFDMDKEKAKETRDRLLKRVAEARVPFIGYHMPFPGLGFLHPKDEGYEFVPASYQFNLPKDV